MVGTVKDFLPSFLLYFVLRIAVSILFSTAPEHIGYSKQFEQSDQADQADQTDQTDHTDHTDQPDQADQTRLDQTRPDQRRLPSRGPNSKTCILVAKAFAMGGSGMISSDNIFITE